MLLRRFNKSCLRVTAPNATEAERPFYERSRMFLHVTRRLYTASVFSFSAILSWDFRFWTASISLICVDCIIEGKATE